MMYHERARAILRSGLRSTHRLVLLAISDHADEHGESWPSVATLARETGLTERGVQLGLRELEGAGVLGSTRSAGRSTTYRLQLGALPPPNVVHPEPVSPLNTVHPTPEPRSPPPLNLVHPVVNTVHPNGSGTGQLNDPLNEPSAVRSSGGRVFQVWLTHWLDKHPRSTKRKWTNEESKLIKQALDQASEEQLTAMVVWAFTGHDSYARMLQGLEGINGSEPKEFLGIETLFKSTKLGKRIQCAEEPQAPKRINGGPAPPNLDIDALYAEAKRRHPCPEPCTDDQRNAWIDELQPIVRAIRAERSSGPSLGSSPPGEPAPVARQGGQRA